ncbi:sensor histidine kinase [Sphingomonas aerolata]|uniref:sensor histidine kinase n=1 Tax=Sphingomonas aerolata TaxID=185951 RepID=UPI00208F11A1|nr:sensor histidine kinase [Sphingomonas aerolata]USR00327.1 ATP-binding protein [Sphingomonas aerolata]
MAFRIMARTILELGAELISSDGIALYELIKNSVDAGSRRVRIDVVAHVTRSQFDELLSLIDFERDRNEIRRQASIAFRQPRLVAIPASLVQDLDERLTDADGGGSRAAATAWYEEHNWITVSDTGDGMSLQALDEVYLTIGTRSRREQREAIIAAGGGRAPLGEKGVGRLSTMRLGDRLEVKTTRKGDPRHSILEVDWSLFSHESDALLEDVVVEPRKGGLKPDSSRKGTTVTIRALRGDWSAAKLEGIARDEFARLVDPFEKETANDLLRLTFNGAHVDIPEIDRKYLDLAHGTCTARLVFEDGRPVIHGVSEYRLRGKRRPFTLNATEVVTASEASSLDVIESLGPFEMEMWWFNRRLITGSEVGTQKEIRDEVNRWSGGLMLFRDGYRVNPYGGGSDDWLELDRKAFASRGYKLNRQQVIGRVRISWQNDGLFDQTNREGLTDTPEKRAMVRLLQKILLTEFKSFIDTEDKAARIQEKTTFENIEEKIETTEEEVRSRLRRIEQLLPNDGRHLVDQALRLIKEMTSYLGEARAIADEVASDRAQLVHLAGVGLMVEFIMHELERTTSATLETLGDIDRTSLPRADASAMIVLTDQLTTISKRVANLDPLSAARRQVKETFDVGELIRDIVSGHGGKIARHGIDVDGTYLSARPWRIKAVRGMFIQIIENLLSNSFFWVKQEHRIDPSLKPRITINVEPDERVVTLTDNGPGVAPEMASEIFQPFVTRRPAGEGHGLGLYISREVAKYHDWALDLERVSTVRPGRYNTFVLDMSGQ